MTVRRLFTTVSAAGLLIAAALCLAFGVLDVQCWDSATGPYWDATSQSCDAPPLPSKENQE